MNTTQLALSAALIVGVGAADAATDHVVADTLIGGEDIQAVAGNYDLTLEQIPEANPGDQRQGDRRDQDWHSDLHPTAACNRLFQP